jgi:hypothetical protein
MVEHDVSSRVRKYLGYGPPDTLAAAGNKCDLSMQASLQVCPVRLDRLFYH